MQTFDAEIIKFNHQWASIRLDLALIRMDLALKAGFRPSQPRIPAGNPEGGQWTRIPGFTRISRSGRRGGASRTVTIHGRRMLATEDQLFRLTESQAEMSRALEKVHSLEPNWRPTPQAYETVEGQINANWNITNEALHRWLTLRAPNAGIGPYASGWIPAPPRRRLHKAEQEEINRIGRESGCHNCGTKDPGTPKGNFVGDHQLPKRWGNRRNSILIALRVVTVKAVTSEIFSGENNAADSLALP